MTVAAAVTFKALTNRCAHHSCADFGRKPQNMLDLRPDLLRRPMPPAVEHEFESRALDVVHQAATLVRVQPSERDGCMLD
jgi:hypothetical protein